MKHVKELAALLLCLTLILALAACSGGKTNSSADGSGASAASSEERQGDASEAAESAGDTGEEGSAAEDASASEESEAGEDGAGESAAQEDATGSNGKFNTMADFIASDVMQEQLSTLEGDALAVEILADGDKLVYNFTYEDLEGQDPSVLGDALKAVLDSDSMKSTFGGIAASLPDVVNVENAAVVVNYLGPDGAVLASREYTGG